MEVTAMRTFAFVGGALLLSASIAAAAPLTRALEADGLSALTLVQEKKSDTVTARVKRAWKDLVGYKFDVACPILFPISRRTCTETGKSRDEARAKCAAQNQFCLISDAR
jgi:hypothetical protein